MYKISFDFFSETEKTTAYDNKVHETSLSQHPVTERSAMFEMQPSVQRTYNK